MKSSLCSTKLITFVVDPQHGGILWNVVTFWEVQSQNLDSGLMESTTQGWPHEGMFLFSFISTGPFGLSALTEMEQSHSATWGQPQSHIWGMLQEAGLRGSPGLVGRRDTLGETCRGLLNYGQH